MLNSPPSLELRSSYAIRLLFPSSESFAFQNKEQEIIDKLMINLIRIYLVGYFGVLGNLIGSLSWSYRALFTPLGVNNERSKQNKMAAA